MNAVQHQTRTPPTPSQDDLAAMAAEHINALYSRALRLAGRPADAWDLVQDTLEHAIRGMHRFRPGSNMRGWLMTILHHIFIDDRRRQAREPAVDAYDESEMAGEEVGAPPLWTFVEDVDVERAFGQLETPYREAVTLRLVQNCSYEEIAARLLIPRATVGTRLLRARQKLRAALIEYALSRVPASS